MPAVVRVKRRVDEEPLSAFVLNGKKRRLDDGTAEEAGAFAQTVFADSEDVSTVLKFAGTIEQQDNNATTRFARLNKDEAKELVLQKSKRLSNATERARQQTRQAMQENRFKIVNCMRTTLNLDEDEGAVGGSQGINVLLNEDGASAVAGSSRGLVAATKEVTIVDIEKQSANTSPNGASTSSSADSSHEQAEMQNIFSPSDSDTGYVYDLYLPENEQQAENVDLMDNNHLSVRAFDDFFYEDRFNNEDDDHDSEDSNHENYYTNDYPDEDDDFEFGGAYYNDDESETQREIRDAVQNLHFEVTPPHVPNDSSEEEDFEPYHENLQNRLARRFFSNYDPNGSRGFGNRYEDDESYYYEDDQQYDSDDPTYGSPDNVYQDNEDADTRIM